MKSIVWALLIFVASPLAAGAVTIDWAIVGNPGNSGDRSVTSRPGAVPYSYRISKTEVTNAQYAEFLNAVAKSDPHALYSVDMGTNTHGGIIRTGASGSYSYTVKPPVLRQGIGGGDYDYANKPVVYVSRVDALRFANWMHNGQGAGDTEHGAYDFPNILLRAAGAKVFLPTHDEWHKAAYHKNDGPTGNYWAYPTSSDVVPNNDIPSLDAGNSANYYDGNGFFEEGITTGKFFYPMTDVGAFALSRSPYGTFDQGGNVWEIMQTSGSYGSSWRRFYDELNGNRSQSDGTSPVGYDDVGFRLAALIPEPSSHVLTILALGVTALSYWRRPAQTRNATLKILRLPPTRGSNERSRRQRRSAGWSNEHMQSEIA